MKILIVDDDYASILILRKIMSDFGVVNHVSNGKKALQAFKEGWSLGMPYDLIFLDIMMPDMTGHKVLSVIREIEQSMHIPQIEQVRVIVTTALDDEKSVKHAFYDGRASAYLVKPIMRNDVLEEIKNIGII